MVGITEISFEFVMQKLYIVRSDFSTVFMPHSICFYSKHANVKEKIQDLLQAYKNVHEVEN